MPARSSRWSSIAFVAMVVLAFFAFTARAQPDSESTKIFRTFAMGSDITDVFYDLAGKPVAVTAGTAGFSTPFAIPAGGKVIFYRLLPPEIPEGKPRRVPVAEAQMNGSGPFLIFLAPDPRDPLGVQLLLVADSWETHPVRTMRILNFSKRAVLVKMGGTVTEVPTAKSEVFDYGDTGQAWLQIAAKESGQWVMRSSIPHITPPTARMTVILSDQQPTEDRPITDELNFFKFVEPAPVPPAP